MVTNNKCLCKPNDEELGLRYAGCSVRGECAVRAPCAAATKKTPSTPFGYDDCDPSHNLPAVALSTHQRYGLLFSVVEDYGVFQCTNVSGSAIVTDNAVDPKSKFGGECHPMNSPGCKIALQQPAGPSNPNETPPGLCKLKKLPLLNTPLANT